MKKLKRFTKAELRAYIADHPVVHDPNYRSEPHMVIYTGKVLSNPSIIVNVDPTDIVSVPAPIKKRKKK